LITDGQSGYLVERGDTESMSARLLELLNNPALRTRIGKTARKTVGDKFDLRTNVAQLIEAYEIKPAAQLSTLPAGDLRKPARIDPLLVLEDES